MPRTLNREAKSGYRSVSTLSTMARPPVSAAVRETSGAAIRQGPHQTAQKSTSTGTRAFSTISSNNRESTSSGSAKGLSVDLQSSTASGIRKMLGGNSVLSATSLAG